MSAFRPCVVVPTYDNPKTVEAVVRRLREEGAEAIFVVDDGSHEEGKLACERVADIARVHRFEKNRGKGAATMAGLALAEADGYTHAAQVDADGQHDLTLLSKLFAVSEKNPEAVVLGYPEYDETVNRVRFYARRFTQLWIDLEVGRGVIRDALIGFRVYPIDATLAAGIRGERMDFDIEAPVRLAWRGTPIVNFAVPVRYLTKEEGGVSHFRPLRDNLRFSWLHSRLCTRVFFRWLARRMRRYLPRRTTPPTLH